MTHFHILTLFPEALRPYARASILARAHAKRLITVSFLNFRAHATDKHNTVDGRAYGGGPGMVLKIEPIYKAVRAIKRKYPAEKTRVILFSTRGKPFTQHSARRFAKYKHLVLICGHYEGVDERVARYVADEEISIGDFILSGGELPALIVVDAVSRHIPGVLGNRASLEEHKGSYPVYTKPERFMPTRMRGTRRVSWNVPPVLLSGNHANIAEWRKRMGNT